MGRRLIALTAAAAGLAAGVVPAHSAWQVPGQVTIRAQSSSLSEPGPVTAGAATTTSITLSWVAATSMPSGTTGYFVERTVAGAGAWTPACGTTPASTISVTSCTDSGLTASTAYEYRVTSAYAKWRRHGSPSGVVTTSAAPVVRPPSRLALSGCTAGRWDSSSPDRSRTLTVVLVDSQGTPTARSADTAVSLHADDTAAGSVPAGLTIVSGRSSGTVSVTSTQGNAPGERAFLLSASAPDLPTSTCLVTE